jgi:hypothetical protein
MRILGIHGIGHADAQTDWQPQWTTAITTGLQTWNPAAAPEFEFLTYDQIFEASDLNTPVVLEAFVKLTASGLFYGIADIFRNRRGLGDTLEDVRWTAGMVAQWVALDRLRAQLRTQLAARIRAFQPDVIAAHSLGSLIAYDTLRTDEVANPAAALGAGRTLVTLGSQIGNPAVRATFGGRVEELATVRFWWHLYNAEDDVFTCPIVLPTHDHFRQVDTYFDIAGWADHDGAHYLGHDEATRTVWQDVASMIPRGRALAVAKAPASLARPARRTAHATARSAPQRRALLVGIGDYPDPTSRLDGPVNDAFSVSAALQELGFPADGIRVVLNDRATAEGIRERLKWLLADAKDHDELFFFYAGHGAQIPAYGRDAEVDHIDECLVPYDFDWSAGRAITDDEFCGLYSQLPYKARFTAMFDCCHAGGMTRGGGVKTRGLTPPDDIRHRMIRWNRATQMWIPRQRFADKPSSAPAPRLKRKGDREAWVGKSGAVRRLGRATSLWLPTDRAFEQAKKAGHHHGPYAPILYEACAEGESAYEYRHGVESHGAFTYAMCGVLRDAARAPGRARRGLTFDGLLAEATRRIESVVAEPQHPQLVCPHTRRKEHVPGLA